jgi:hypothetical protein
VGHQLLESISERFGFLLKAGCLSAFSSAIRANTQNTFTSSTNSVILAVKYQTMNSRNQILFYWPVAQFRSQNSSIQTCYRVRFGFSPIPKFDITGLEQAFIPCFYQLVRPYNHYHKKYPLLLMQHYSVSWIVFNQNNYIS